ncbi:MAG: regulatory protein RecX [Bacteroidales bacterium]
MNTKAEIKKKVYDKNTAFLKAQYYCAYQERSQQEVRNKLYEWGLHSEDVENIIVDLITQNFINEERFAILFAVGKFRIKNWGKNKIKNELKFRKISSYCIQKALNAIDNDEYMLTLKRLIDKKSALTKEKNKYKKFSKVVGFLVSKGYEPELVRELMNQSED